MSFPTTLTNAIDGVTEVVAAHLNNLEAKVGTDNSAVTTSLDYLLRNSASIDPGHKHTAGAITGGNDGDVFYKAAGAWGPGTPDAAGLVAKSGDQSIAGVKTFTSIPLGPGSNPTTDNQLARKAYVDLMLPLAGGNMAGNIAMNNNKVTGLAAATGAGEALRYDEWITTQDPGHKHSKLWASNGSPEAVTVDAAGVATFAGIPVGPASNPTTTNQLARKAYVDLFLPLAGGTMAGNIAMNNNKVTGLAAASGAGEAVRYNEWIAAQDPGHKHSKLWASDGSPEAVTVDAVGNVTLAARLDVTGLIRAGEYGSFPAAGTGIEIFYQGANSSGYLFVYDRSGGSPKNLGLGGSGNAVIIKSTGEVGMAGNMNPNYALTMEASGGGYYSSSDHAWHNGSSIRWKENIKPIENPLAILQKLAGITFNWKDTGIPGMSLIAEEVGKVIPEAVSFSKENPRYADGINPLALVGLLVEGFKAQQAQIEVLQAKLN